MKLDSPNELARKRKKAERLYKEAVKNLNVKPTNMERQTAIKQTMT